MSTSSTKDSRVDRRVYDEPVREALTVLWGAADRICGKRLKSLLRALFEAMEAHDAAVKSRLLAIRPATDRPHAGTGPLAE